MIKANGSLAWIKGDLTQKLKGLCFLFERLQAPFDAGARSCGGAVRPGRFFQRIAERIGASTSFKNGNLRG